MTRAELEELKASKTFFMASDIKKIFECGTELAYVIIQRIKKHNDSLCIAGKVTIADFEVWYERKEPKAN